MNIYQNAHTHTHIYRAHSRFLTPYRPRAFYDAEFRREICEYAVQIRLLIRICCWKLAARIKFTHD